MAVHCLYEDFFRFLKALGSAQEDPWELYQRVYFHPHRNFFAAYWRIFFPQMDLRTLQDRVRRVRQGHYAILEQLVSHSKLEDIVKEVLSRCLRLLPQYPEPDVYLMVGFFSADGYIVEVEGWPVIGIGLERYRDFRLLDIILAHEYCHYARRLALGCAVPSEPERLGQKILAEGLSVAFSQRVHPQRELTDHLLMSRRRLNWCQQNEALLESMVREELGASRLVPVLFGPGKSSAGIPPRAGMYLGYRLVQRALVERSFEQLLTAQDISDIWSGEMSSE